MMLTILDVMAGRSPGHPRLVCGATDVDARNKSGHDGIELLEAFCKRSTSLPFEAAEIGYIRVCRREKALAIVLLFQRHCLGKDFV